MSAAWHPMGEKRRPSACKASRQECEPHHRAGRLARDNDRHLVDRPDQPAAGLCAAAPPAAPSAHRPRRTRGRQAGRGLAAGRPSQASRGGQPAAAQPRPGPASGQIVVVYRVRANTLVPKDVSTNIGYFVLDNVYDHLTARDYSSGRPKIVPQLAESWTRVDPNTWRFKLRQGVKFTNGELFNADAVVDAVEDMADPQKPGLAAHRVRHPPVGQEGRRVHRRHHHQRPRPDPAGTAGRTSRSRPRTGSRPPAQKSWRTQAVGSGPYLLAEYQKGQLPAVQGQPELLGAEQAEDRRDQADRPAASRRSAAAMLQAGEADLAFHLALEHAKKVPAGIIEQTQESPIVRHQPRAPGHAGHPGPPGDRRGYRHPGDDQLAVPGRHRGAADTARSCARARSAGARISSRTPTSRTRPSG